MASFCFICVSTSVSSYLYRRNFNLQAKVESTSSYVDFKR